MQEARDLPLDLGRLREIAERGRVLEELSLNFGREGTPSQDDRGSQTFQNLLFFGESFVDFQRCRHSDHPPEALVCLHLCVRFARKMRGSAALVVPPGGSEIVLARISLRSCCSG